MRRKPSTGTVSWSELPTCTGASTVHGESPHAEQHIFEVMTFRGLDPAVLLGVHQPARALLLVDAATAPAPGSADEARLLAALSATASVVVAVADDLSPAVCNAADVVLTTTEPDSPDVAATAVVVPDIGAAVGALEQQIDRTPVAATSLVWLLRRSHQLPVRAALEWESAIYSMLLFSAEFRSWVHRRGDVRPPDTPDRVRVARDGDVLRVTMTRPGRRNAMDARMRDALCAAFDIAAADPDLQVVLDAEGPSFCAGGDLDEFGTAADPGTAHLVRISASAGLLMHSLRRRLTVRVHGACIGAGVELPAFAGRVVAHADAYFGLPELSMGLVPGAGGTVSLTRRIGRHRTAWIALSGQPCDARTALHWALIDAIEE